MTRDDLLGKVVVIDFWATWCGPCLVAVPELNAAYLKYRDREDVVFLVVNTRWKNTEDDARSFAGSRPYEFPYAMDEDERMTDAFNVGEIPTTVVLDPEGREAFRHIEYDGPDYVAELSLEIDLLLGEYTGSGYEIASRKWSPSPTLALTTNVSVPITSLGQKNMTT